MPLSILVLNNIEIDRSIRLIRVSIFDDLLYEVYDLRYILRDPGDNIR